MPITILATTDIVHTLSLVGRAGCIPQDIQERLAKRLAEPEGKVEPKGRGFYGMDLGPAVNLRSVFTLTEDNTPLLVFLGDHREYDAFSTDVREDSDGMKKNCLAKSRAEALLTSKKLPDEISLENFNAKFLKAIGITDAPEPANRAAQAEKANPLLYPVLDTPWEKLTAQDDVRGRKYVYDPDCDFLITLERNKSLTITYENASVRFAQVTKDIDFAVMSAEECRAFIAEPLPPAEKKGLSATFVRSCSSSAEPLQSSAQTKHTPRPPKPEA